MKKLILSMALTFIALTFYFPHSQENPSEPWKANSQRALHHDRPLVEKSDLKEEEIKKLQEYSRQVKECLKRCREIEEKIHDLTRNIEGTIKKQQKIFDQLLQETDQYNKTINRCQLPIFENKKMGSVHIGHRSSHEMQGSGVIIPVECKNVLNQIRKDMATILSQWADLVQKGEEPLQEWDHLDESLSNILKNGQKMVQKGIPISHKIRSFMEEGSAPPSSIEALALYDASRERMNKASQRAEERRELRRGLLSSSRKISRQFASYRPLLWGLPINKNWSWLRFPHIQSMMEAIEPYSGGLYIPACILLSLHEPEMIKEPATRKVSQKIDIPKDIKIIAPDTMVDGMPITLSIWGERESPLSKILIETDRGQIFTSNEKGRVHISSLTSPCDFISLWVPGTVSIPSFIRILKDMPPLPESEKALSIEMAADIALMGTLYSVHGSGFDGFADNTEISIGGKRLSPLAESLSSLTFLLPQDIEPGSYTVGIHDNERRAEFPLLCIHLELSAPHSDLKKGETTKGTILIRGTERPLAIELINDSPSKISIQPHIVQVRQGRGAFEIKGLEAGPFRITIGGIEFFRK